MSNKVSQRTEGTILSKNEASPKKRIFDIIQIGNREDVPSTVFDIFIVVAIFTSIITTILQTFDNLSGAFNVLSSIELTTIIIFIVEFLLRVWTANYLYPDKKYPVAVLKFVTSFYGIIDILTILSFFAPFMFSNGFVALRMLRVVRILRLFKVSKTYDAFNVITDVLKSKRSQIISSVFMILMLMLMSSMSMYSLEHEAQPEVFKNAFSGFWWSVSTMLTVGYGDIYPITIPGRVLAIILSFLGVGLVAIPTGIISAGFVEHFQRVKNGSDAEYEADFVALDISEEILLKDLVLPKGLYPAVVLRSKDIFVAYHELRLKPGDTVVLGSTSSININAHLKEVKLKPGHPWIGYSIKDLDISRQTFIVMVKRKNKQLQPKGDMVLQEYDHLIMLEKRVNLL